MNSVLFPNRRALVIIVRGKWHHVLFPQYNELSDLKREFAQKSQKQTELAQVGVQAAGTV